jgi:hypothetical protein
LHIFDGSRQDGTPSLAVGRESEGKKIAVVIRFNEEAAKALHRAKPKIPLEELLDTGLTGPLLTPRMRDSAHLAIIELGETLQQDGINVSSNSLAAIAQEVSTIHKQEAADYYERGGAKSSSGKIPAR